MLYHISYLYLSTIRIIKGLVGCNNEVYTEMLLKDFITYIIH